MKSFYQIYKMTDLSAGNASAAPQAIRESQAFSSQAERQRHCSGDTTASAAVVRYPSSILL